MDLGEEQVNEVDDALLRGDIVEIHQTESGEQGIAQKQPLEKDIKAASEIFLEFLEVAIHQILYARKLYSEEIFLLRKKYHVPVHISSHPGLNEYITNALSSLDSLLQENRICHVSVLIEDGQIPIENYLFEVRVLQNSLSKESEFLELEQSLRSFILKILSTSVLPETLSPTCSFEILVGCNADCEVDLNIVKNSTKWIKVDHADFTKPIKPDDVFPVKALTDSPILNMQLVVEKL